MNLTVVGSPPPPFDTSCRKSIQFCFSVSRWQTSLFAIVTDPFFFFFLESACLLLLAQHMHEQEFVVQKEKNSLLLNWPIWR